MTAQRPKVPKITDDMIERGVRVLRGWTFTGKIDGTDEDFVRKVLQAALRG